MFFLNYKHYGSVSLAISGEWFRGYHVPERGGVVNTNLCPIFGACSACLQSICRFTCVRQSEIYLGLDMKHLKKIKYERSALLIIDSDNRTSVERGEVTSRKIEWESKRVPIDFDNVLAYFKNPE
jgi:hypothetical protein